MMDFYADPSNPAFKINESPKDKDTMANALQSQKLHKAQI